MQVWEITESLYQSGSVTPSGSFVDYGITAVISLTTEWVPAEFDRAQLFLRCPLSDGPVPDDERWGETVRGIGRLVATLMQAGHVVLVHCSAGLNRSGLISALALIYQGYTPEGAIDMVRKGRGPDALFNPAFVEFLRRCDSGSNIDL